MNYLSVHFRIVAAFTIREAATRFGRSPGGYIWAFLEPIAYIYIITALRGMVGGVPRMGNSYALFYASGYLAFHLYSSMYGYVVSAISSNKSLMRYPKVAPIDAVVARAVLQGFTSILVTSIIIYVCLHAERHPVPLHWPQLFEAIALAWALACGIALINTVLFAKSPLYEKAYAIVSRPLVLLSGVFYVPADLPHPAKDVLLWNPITHIVILFREGIYGGAGLHGLDIGFVTGAASAAVSVGLFLFTFVPVARERIS